MIDVEETWDVMRAMQCLLKDNRMWLCNLNSFMRMKPLQRYQWWQRAKRHAELGAPAMQLLVLKVIELKLTR
jgi:hypothetical protein